MEGNESDVVRKVNVTVPVDVMYSPYCVGLVEAGLSIAKFAVTAFCGTPADPCPAGAIFPSATEPVFRQICVYPVKLLAPLVVPMVPKAAMRVMFILFVGVIVAVNVVATLVVLVELDCVVAVLYTVCTMSPGFFIPGVNNLMRVGGAAHVPAVTSVASKYPTILKALLVKAAVV